jgi:glycosyltransferase involved in cell wall biosynthesis
VSSDHSANQSGKVSSGLRRGYVALLDTARRFANTLLKNVAKLQTTPDISVVVAIHNKERYLAQCLASVLSQNGVKLEVICIDDASTDSSLEVVAQFEKDGRVRLLRNSTNTGPGPSRNMGIQTARGRYLQFTDADDLLLPNALARLFSAAIRTDAEVVQGRIQRLRGGKVVECTGANSSTERVARSIRRLAEGNVIDRAKSFTDRLGRGIQKLRGVVQRTGAKSFTERVGSFEAFPDLWTPWFHQSFLISRELLTRARALYPPLRIGEDPVFLAKVLTSASRICSTSQIVYALRLDDDRKTQSAVTPFHYIKDYIEHARLVKEIYGERYSKAWTAYREFIIPDIRMLLSRTHCDDGKTRDDLERRIAGL